MQLVIHISVSFIFFSFDNHKTSILTSLCIALFFALGISTRMMMMFLLEPKTSPKREYLRNNPFSLHLSLLIDIGLIPIIDHVFYDKCNPDSEMKEWVDSTHDLHFFTYASISPTFSKINPMSLITEHSKPLLLCLLKNRYCELMIWFVSFHLTSVSRFRWIIFNLYGLGKSTLYFVLFY